MTTTRYLLLALLASLTLGLVSTVEAAPPQALLIAPEPEWYDLPRFGFSSYNIYGIGERVTGVRWGSLAARIGLERGDVILAMNGFPLTYHGAWNDSLREAMYNGGWVQLTIRDVRTGRLAVRETYVGSYGPGPITPRSHITTYHGPHTSHVVVGGPLTHKSQKHVKKFKSHDFDEQIKKLAKMFD